LGIKSPRGGVYEGSNGELDAYQKNYDEDSCHIEQVHERLLLIPSFNLRVM
jgi:hypothetical protein